MAVLAGLILAGSDGARAGEVDLALVLAIDISLSVSEEEHRLQLDGYARAFRDRAVQGAIDSGPHRTIAVAVLEWADKVSPLPSIGWTLICDAASAERFAAAIQSLPYRPIAVTSIGSAIEFSRMLLEAVPHKANRRVIDISGDGQSRRPDFLANARQRAIDAGITINGLPICDPSEPCDLPDYYLRSVIGGPGAFTVVASSFANFGTAIRRKLVLEIALRPSEMELALALASWPESPDQ